MKISTKCSQDEFWNTWKYKKYKKNVEWSYWSGFSREAEQWGMYSRKGFIVRGGLRGPRMWCLQLEAPGNWYVSSRAKLKDWARGRQRRQVLTQAQRLDNQSTDVCRPEQVPAQVRELALSPDSAQTLRGVGMPTHVGGGRSLSTDRSSSLLETPSQTHPETVSYQLPGRTSAQPNGHIKLTIQWPSAVHPKNAVLVQHSEANQCINRLKNQKILWLSQ